MDKPKKKILIADISPIMTLEKIKCLYLLGLPRLRAGFIDTVHEEIIFQGAIGDYRGMKLFDNLPYNSMLYATDRGIDILSDLWQQKVPPKFSNDIHELALLEWLNNLEEKGKLNLLSEHIVLTDNYVVASAINKYASNLTSKPLCLSTLSFIKSLQEAQLIQSADDIVARIKSLSKRDTLEEHFEQYSQFQVSPSWVIKKNGYKNIGEFLAEYYRRGYPMPENPDKEENQRTITQVASIFKKNINV